MKYKILIVILMIAIACSKKTDEVASSDTVLDTAGLPSDTTSVGDSDDVTVAVDTAAAVTEN